MCLLSQRKLRPSMPESLRMAVVSSRSPDPVKAMWRNKDTPVTPFEADRSNNQRASQGMVQESLRRQPGQQPSGCCSLQLYELKLNFPMGVIQNITIMCSASGHIGMIGLTGVKSKATFNRRCGRASTNIWCPIFAIFGAPHLAPS